MTQIEQLYLDIQNLNEDLEGRFKRRGECDKYIFSSGRKKCRAEVDEQIAQIEGEIAFKIKEIEQLQQLQQNANSGNQSPYQTSNSPITAGGGNNKIMMYLGIAVIAGLLFIPAKPKKSPKPKNK